MIFLDQYCTFINYRGISKILVTTMKFKIEKYSFGKMIIGENVFTSDLIIHSDGHIQDNWWRVQGHRLQLDDITTALDSVPKKLIIGTGAIGLMRVSENVLNLCKKQKIEVVVCRTAMAVKRYNEATEAGIAVAACFHLTC